MATKKPHRVHLEQLKKLLAANLPEGHRFLLAVVDTGTGELRFNAGGLPRAVCIRTLEELLAELKGTRQPVKNIHHRMPVITK